jgi:hypothetical protein
VGAKMTDNKRRDELSQQEEMSKLSLTELKPHDASECPRTLKEIADAEEEMLY